MVGHEDVQEHLCVAGSHAACVAKSAGRHIPHGSVVGADFCYGGCQRAGYEEGQMADAGNQPVVALCFQHQRLRANCRCQFYCQRQCIRAGAR